MVRTYFINVSDFDFTFLEVVFTYSADLGPVIDHFLHWFDVFVVHTVTMLIDNGDTS